MLMGLFCVVPASAQMNDMDDATVEESDTTAPTFVSATTSTSGENVIMPFSEPVGAPSLIVQIAEQLFIDLETFYRVVMTVTVDDHIAHAILASMSGSELTLRLETPIIGSDSTGWIHI